MALADRRVGWVPTLLFIWVFLLILWIYFLIQRAACWRRFAFQLYVTHHEAFERERMVEKIWNFQTKHNKDKRIAAREVRRMNREKIAKRQHRETVVVPADDHDAQSALPEEKSHKRQRANSRRLVDQQVAKRRLTFQHSAVSVNVEAVAHVQWGICRAQRCGAHRVEGKYNASFWQKCRRKRRMCMKWYSSRCFLSSSIRSMWLVAIASEIFEIVLQTSGAFSASNYRNRNMFRLIILLQCNGFSYCARMGHYEVAVALDILFDASYVLLDSPLPF